MSGTWCCRFCLVSLERPPWFHLLPCLLHWCKWQDNEKTNNGCRCCHEDSLTTWIMCKCFEDSQWLVDQTLRTYVTDVSQSKRTQETRGESVLVMTWVPVGSVCVWGVLTGYKWGREGPWAYTEGLPGRWGHLPHMHREQVDLPGLNWLRSWFVEEAGNTIDSKFLTVTSTRRFHQSCLGLWPLVIAVSTSRSTGGFFFIKGPRGNET